MLTNESQQNALVLVVDDDTTVRMVAREILEQADFTVEEATNGQEALEVFSRIQPDIILLDISMPKMDGFEVCTRLRKKQKGEDIPILMVTGTNDLESINRAYEVGATDFITKPINWLILNQRVRYMLRASSAFHQLQKSKITLSKAQQIARLGSWEMDIESEQFVCSEELNRIYGLNSQSSIDHYEAFLKFVHPDEQEYISRLFVRSFEQGRPFQADHRIISNNGTERIVSQQVEVSLNEEGQVVQLTGTIQDITERKRSELLEIDRSRVMEMILQGEAPNTIMLELMRIIERQRPGTSCSVCLRRDNKLHVEGALHLPQDFILAIDGQLIKPDMGCCSAAAYYGDTVTVPDITKSIYWKNSRDFALTNNLKACIAVPIFSGKGQVLGSIGLYYQKNYTSDDSDRHLLEILSQLVAIATERHKLTEQLFHITHHDGLTGLPNRSLFQDQLGQGIALASRLEEKMAIVYIDLDRFKYINDSYGHHIGDLFLKQVAERVHNITYDNDNIPFARLGGDEFVLLLKNTSRQAITKFVTKLLNLLTTPVKIEDYELHISASIGISVYPDDGLDSVTLQRKADIAMYFSKNHGGNRYTFFTSELHQTVIERLQLENEMRKSLERKEFQLHYQPQFRLDSQELIGVEALLRWNHLELGLISPAKFIPIAEETGLIVPLGTWVLQKACEQNAMLQKNEFRPFKVGVNVSAIQLREPDFFNVVQEALQTSGLAPQWLELEVTETALIQSLERVTKCFVALRKFGVSIAVDDFGTGYSSLAYLKGLPIDYLKVDRSFVNDIGTLNKSSKQAQALMKTIVNLARDLDLKLVAEGIETLEQCNFLQEAGFDIGQGFYFQKPMSEQKLYEFLQVI